MKEVLGMKRCGSSGGKFTLTRGKFSLCFCWEFIGPDLLVKITGGEAHIGAVSLGGRALGSGAHRTLTRPRHREDVITERALRALRPCVPGVICVIAGIHFDHLSCGEVKTVVRLSVIGLGRLKKNLLQAPPKAGCALPDKET
jgi:hypothetical protein